MAFSKRGNFRTERFDRPSGVDYLRDGAAMGFGFILFSL
jgi:hypothetical protein